jgi:hypothetical protein
MVVAFAPTQPTSPDRVILYGVVVEPSLWVHRLFLAEELEVQGDLQMQAEVRILVGDFENTLGVVRRIVESTDSGKINYFRTNGWFVPLGEFVMASPEPDKLARFQECNAAIDAAVESWRVAAEAALEIERDELWKVAGYPSNRAYWVEKSDKAALEGRPQVGYDRIMQLVGAARTAEALDANGVDVAAFSSEKALRAVRSAPEQSQAAIAQAAVAESAATGRPVTEALVRKVSLDVVGGYSLPQVQALYAPHGVFKPFSPTTRKNQKFRFIFEGAGLTRLFETLGEAAGWDRLPLLLRRTDMGCPTCDHCTLSQGSGECLAGHGHITHTRLWNMPSHCQQWQEAGADVATLDVPIAENYPNIVGYLNAAGYHLGDPADCMEFDTDPGKYRGWSIATESQGDLMFIALQTPGGDWYLANAMVEGEPLCGASLDGAIAYSQRVIDGCIAIYERDQAALPFSAPSTPQQNIHDRMVASASSRKEPSPHDENNTPQAIWQPALTARGLAAYTLDPMTNADSTVPATVQWTAADDCFAQPTWRVGEQTFMFSNPAFSLNDDFSQRFIQELEAGHIDEALILDKADSRTAWGQRLLGKADLIIRIFGYTKFENADRENGSATFPLELLYYGPNVKQIAQAYQHLGLPTVPYKF